MKWYRIKVGSPADLAQQIQQRNQINGRSDQRNWLYFGLSSRGYYAVLLMRELSGR
ncbi:MAG: DUF2931 family protein [Symbiopectobacterium sp.]|uniref:DUF2931 family protein n=1 Tax=Symbiopectobacterium sp. TaxID=2952789 RepID=UPI0039EBE3B7